MDDDDWEVPVDKDDPEILDLIRKRDLIEEDIKAITKPLRSVRNDINKAIAQKRLAKLTEEPKCPECGASALRQKCMWESGNCPRREACEPYGGSYAVEKHFAELKKSKE